MYRLLIRELDLKMPVVIRSSVARIASKAGLSEKTKRKALEILKKLRKAKFQRERILWACSTALYVACVMNGENKTQKDVAEGAGVTEVTIRNRYKGLKTHLKL